jgi:hypothetical protein
MTYSGAQATSKRPICRTKPGRKKNSSKKWLKMEESVDVPMLIPSSPVCGAADLLQMHNASLQVNPTVQPSTITMSPFVLSCSVC